MYQMRDDPREQVAGPLAGQKFKLKDGRELVGSTIIRSRKTLLIRTTNGEIVTTAVNQLVSNKP